MSRSLLKPVLLLVAAVVLAFPAPVAAEDDVPSESLVLFWGNGCPHCAREREFLQELSVEFPELPIVQHEVWYDEPNRSRFVESMAALGREPRAVPTTIYGDHVWEGFDDSTGEQIRLVVAAELRPPSAADPEEPAPPETEDTVSLPIIGEVAVAPDSLVVSTLAIGFVDGFNPCSLWVLSMLLALVLHTRSRKRILAVGGVFLLVTTALYGLYIAGVYSVLSYVAYLDWVRVAVALLALTFGLVNLKDFVWFGKGPSLMIPEAKKGKLYPRMRSVASADRPLPQVLGGTAALAVGVSLIETPCTAGFPIMWANLLSDAGVGFRTAAALFGVYMAVFLLDELAILGVAVGAMRVTRIQERHGRVLKLVGGMVMVTLAGVLLLAPGLMESVAGALAVLAIATVLCGLALLAERLRRPPQTKVPPSRQRAPTH